ncbi:MAG: NAD(P)/FAD-dependent oxidoreductase [Candidatus Hydrogenedentes bacterium]|nr:NAD(P)/FAD-dependent oxidoreductase [Candidatus Hydrogenedentota bacterium]
MKEKIYDVAIIGAGAAGMASALEIASTGARVVVIDREPHLGGILLQCIHNGFGLHLFKEELTGPEYAERFISEIKRKDIDILLNSTATRMAVFQTIKQINVCSSEHGVFKVNAKAIVLAMGCRERNRGNLGIPGTRPAGIFTAGLAQRLLNIDGYLPGKRVVIVGSGDIGLIMARRLTWTGAEVLGVVEILPYPSGLTRNIVQCLYDYDIPLYLSHVITKIEGRDRVEAVEVTPLENGIPNQSKSFRIECDTLLFSVGLVPENELTQSAGIKINPETGGPIVDARLMTSAEGVFACGNVLHVHDLVDWVSQEAQLCGKEVVAFLEGKTRDETQGRVSVGANLKYVIPNKYRLKTKNRFSMRALVVQDKATLMIKQGERVVKRLPLRHVKPAEMFHVEIKSEDLDEVYENGEPLPLQFSLE